MYRNPADHTRWERCRSRRILRICHPHPFVIYSIIMKKKIRIDFVDFWPDFDKTDNFFYRHLQKFYDVEITPEPDYVFCSVFSDKHLKYADCIKIFFTGENIVPDFNLYDYAMGFHFIDFDDRYLRLPLYVLYTKDVELALKKHTFSDEYYLSKKKFCNRVVSNPDAAGLRDEMYRELCKYKMVDSGGKFRNNVGGPVADKIAFEKDYRLTLAFENSSMRGYITEKILQAFAGDTIPIYWGNPDAASEFNPDAFINCMDYPDIPSMIDRIREVWENDDEYLRMIKAPIAVENSLSAAYLKEDYADPFLQNIFEQDLKTAKRRNMTYIGRTYQKKLKDAMQIKVALDVVKRPMHLFNKKKAQFLSGLHKDES